MHKLLLVILLILIWLFLLFLFHNLKMYFYKFLTGSIGIFTISMFFFLPYLETNLNMLITGTLDVIGKITGYFSVLNNYSLITIDTKQGIVAMFINYECSGIIEILVFTSLALFFPFGGKIRRIISLVSGNIALYLANIIRVIFIIFITKGLGASSFYLAHTLFARILFFIFTVIIYYYVFTSTHLKYQKVGEINE